MRVTGVYCILKPRYNYECKQQCINIDSTVTKPNNNLYQAVLVYLVYIQSENPFMLGSIIWQSSVFINLRHWNLIVTTRSLTHTLLWQFHENWGVFGNWYSTGYHRTTIKWWRIRLVIITWQFDSWKSNWPSNNF